MVMATNNIVDNEVKQHNPLDRSTSFNDEAASADPIVVTLPQQITTSTIGALATSIVVTPMDVIKIRLQAQSKDFFKKKVFFYSNGLMDHICYCVNGTSTGHVHTPNGITAIDPRDTRWYKRPIPGQFNGWVDAMVKIYKVEGIRSFWSGLPPTLVMAIPSTVIYFTTYERLRNDPWCRQTWSNQPVFIPMFCAAVARSISATFISPLEMVRTKLQSERLTYKQIGKAIGQLVQVEGPLSLWRGLGPTLLRDVPFSAIYWGIYETMTRDMHRLEQPKLLTCFLAAATSGSIAALVTLPFDVAKTHRQIELGKIVFTNDETGKQTLPLRGTVHILKDIYRREGYAGLFAGTAPRIIKVAPSCAIMMAFWEYGRKFFGWNNKQSQAND